MTLATPPPAEQVYVGKERWHRIAEILADVQSLTVDLPHTHCVKQALTRVYTVLGTDCSDGGTRPKGTPIPVIYTL